MKILILGASGFIGRNLILRLSNEFETTAVYHNSKDFIEFIESHNINTKTIKCDLSDKNRVIDCLNKRYDVVVSLVANKKFSESFNDPLGDFKNTALSVYNVLSNIEAEKVIYFSSGLVYEHKIGCVSAEETKLNPTIPYAVNKFYAEQFVKLAKIKYNIDKYYIVRFWGAYGPYQSITKIYSKLVNTFGIEKNRNFTIKGDGHSLIDAMYVDDTISAIINMINSDEEDIVFDFSPKQPLSIIDLVMKAAKIFSIKPIIKFEGESYETIDFYLKQEENAFFNDFIPLEEGLISLFDWQKHNIKLL